MMTGWWARLTGKEPATTVDELDEVRAHLDRFKAQGGPEIEAHPHCNNNRTALNESDLAGCFYCCETFDPKLVEEWVDSDDTAICPKCGIDSVIGSASGFPVGDSEFLKRMHEKWF
jgi:hypothetical protein